MSRAGQEVGENQVPWTDLETRELKVRTRKLRDILCLTGQKKMACGQRHWHLPESGLKCRISLLTSHLLTQSAF